MSNPSSFVPLAAAGVGTAAVAAVSLLVVLAGSVDSTAANGLTAGSICATSGPISGLANDAAANARVVAATSFARGGAPLATLALMVGLTESGLRILGNPAQQTGSIPVQGIGWDHDSLGIFQQRRSWGSVQQRLDPVASTNLFDDRVLTIADWQSADPWVIAQQVQVSAYDGHSRLANQFSAEVGGNYHANYQQAVVIAQQIDADSAKAGCDGSGGSDTGTLPAGPTVRHGLPVDYTIPGDPSAPGAVAVRAALAVLGRPYVWDAAGPSSFDCSGLMVWSWGQEGVTLAHYTGDQAKAGVATTATSLVPGDLVLIPGSDGTLADPQHVGMFIGHGLVVEAPETGDVVKVVTYSSFTSGGLSGLRHIK